MASNILFIVEGDRENKLFSHMAKQFGLHADVFVFKSNVYALYSKLKEYDFNANIVDVLKEMDTEQSSILNMKFAYTYLIFDCDAHHSIEDDKRALNDIVLENISILEEMVDYFNDETEPTKGKLYINYPAIEAYRDCDSTFDEDYKERMIKVACLKEYKRITGKRKLSNTRIDSLCQEDFVDLILQNLYKLHTVVNSTWSKPLYGKYLDLSRNEIILQKEKESVLINGSILVLASALFWLVDYFGNRDSFYDKLAKSKKV